MAPECMRVDIGVVNSGRSGLTEEEKRELVRLSREAVGRVAIRALAVLWFNEGRTEREIADLLSVSVRSVSRWIGRYKKRGAEGG